MIQYSELPQHLTPLFDYPLRDTSICLGGDGVYYLTGTTGAPDWWAVTGDIQLWKSSDLEHWEPLITKPRKRTSVWNVDRDGTWQKEIQQRDGAPFRPLWAPEIHFLKDTYWLTYSIPRLGNGLLRSISGKAEGPYVDNIKVDAPLSPHIDASLFQDDDGQVYFLCDNGKMARMNEDMTALAEELRLLSPANAEHVGFEGTFLFKAEGRYHLVGADFVDGDYHCFAASSDKLYGPYGDRYVAIPHGGHNMIFQDKLGQWWSTFFGNNDSAPFKERPGALRIEFDQNGQIRPMKESRSEL
ncbi:family 43 glycosylhydrolase [Paenibacillus sp. WQ 127069]|uniref:Family 43 glycosylhydrolase n=1 Tax=Paenibacillus baimaensis TaxID=2982185 RepID=A0ABT2U8X1_9BACL|nr:family 43 glycosylhydrolase [Paenibacillus sp. WQ 127069]MCU6790987.1 family 43 glycosylhydrolase [Paenibacillus sp. WQ 127069]